MPQPIKERKGTFGPLKLTVSKKYLHPKSRKRVFLIGGAVVALALVFALISYLFWDNAFLSNGPLSSPHANLESDCASCHTTFSSISNEKCSVCHEKFGDQLGVFTFSAHYLYRSDDFTRVQPSEKETTCEGCHSEHLGREAQITEVADARCLACHDFGSFNHHHPQMAFIAENIADNDHLKFTHIHHVSEVMKRENLDDHEKACLYCHNPQADGVNFQPLTFDRHCDACHLTAATATPRLPVAPNAKPGVATLEDLRGQASPGLGWVDSENPGSYRISGRGKYVTKSNVRHEDPWIMENLRQLRQTLYPEKGLAALLRVSADVEAHERATLHEEAIATLERYGDELRSRPEVEVQEELARVDGLLASVKRRLKDPYTNLDRTKFLPDLQQVNPELNPEQLTAIRELAHELTRPCQTCHLIEDAAIARVQKDQRILRRAEFNHRTHIIQARCLDCHDTIPLLAGLAAGGQIDPALDHAGIQNLPAMETCQQCHQPDLASNRCVNCHQFHPSKERRSDLLLYLE